jgi:hypothetical protein
MKFFLSFIVVLLTPSVVGAFVFENPIKSLRLFENSMNIRPGLIDMVNVQKDFKLNIVLSIGDNKVGASQIAIRGMEFDLHKEKPDYDHVKLPGINGPHPNLSTGARKLSMIREGEFIDGMGINLVKTLKGCWEMVWRKDAHAGSLLCGFEIPEDYTRNDATLPKGRIYLSFPVWTKEGLAFGRKKKEEIMGLAKRKIQEKNEALAKYMEEKNPLMKAVHYRNAFAAAADYYDLPKTSLSYVPDEHEVIEIHDDLLLTTKGLVWSKQLPDGKKVLLGTVNALRPVLAGLAP